MSFSVPSFITKRSSQKKVPRDDRHPEVPVASSTPSSTRSKAAPAEKPSSSRKRAFQQTPETPHAGGSRGHKLLKTDNEKGSSDAVPPSPLAAFIDSLKDKIPPQSIMEWGNASLEEAASMVTLANAQSLFLYLKYSNQITEAAKRSPRVHEEVTNLRLEVKAYHEDRKKLLETNKKLYESEGILIQVKEKLLKERESMDLIILKMDKEREDATAASQKEKEKLEMKVRSLQGAVAKYKVIAAKHEDKEYNSGYNAGIKDYMASMYDAFPDLDWSLLGQDVEAIEVIKGEKAMTASEVKADEPPQERMEEAQVETVAQVQEEAIVAPVAEDVGEGSMVEPQAAADPATQEASPAKASAPLSPDTIPQ